MPTYTYGCSNGHESEEFRKVSERHDPFPCPQCGEVTSLQLQAIPLDNLAMGIDSGFPTAYARWEKLQRSKNSGKQWDSNNRRYGGDWDKKK